MQDRRYIVIQYCAMNVVVEKLSYTYIQTKN